MPIITSARRALGAQAAHSIFFKAVASPVKSWPPLKARACAGQSDVRFDLIDFYLNAPGFIGGGKDKAEKEAKIISDLNAKLGYAARASILMKDKKWDQAKKNCTGNYRVPQDPDPYNDLAGFLLDREDFSGAMDSAAKALALIKGLSAPGCFWPQRESVSGPPLMRQRNLSRSSRPVR